ncbi:MAG: DUF2344 domain-containing protein [Spirochaetales bacterium]|nr:MAG: DUF2344 domain-containing protein [Spirochaetales bacterium]
MKRIIDPVGIFGAGLQRVEKPARYLGGESGSTVKPDAVLRMMLCFPDLYEIGMSNNAMRILYAELNALDDVACERVFAPAADYADLLKGSGVPLYGLESGTPVADADILAFTVGYELAATNILGIMDISGIPVRNADRTSAHPIVIAGGPAMTNPAPYANILDAVWIGEAEDAFFALAAELVAMKRGGASRSDLLSRLQSEPAFWIPGKTAVRHVYDGFSEKTYGHRFPIPILKPVQDHGVVEIMRGCPNACRFCHAGFFYRPQRLRMPARILEEVETQVRIAGHREISLTSLSSGDYPGIFRLLSILNKRWSAEGVSFQLPSLKIESFPLELIDQVSGTRKSGLTFAVETPLEQWQMTVNKKAGIDKIRAILSQAESSGYRVAKFYFMIGLPLPKASLSEEEAIVEFLHEVAGISPLRINVTLATFVPKPHTPFQWSAQIQPEEAARRIYAIKDALRGNKNIKISYHGPFLSWLEGIVARGDERVGELLIDAYRRGASFDAWDDKFNKEAWLGALEAASFDPNVLLGGADLDSDLPWDSVRIRVAKSYLKREALKAAGSELTSICKDECINPCGSCSDELSVPKKSIQPEIDSWFAEVEAESVAKVLPSSVTDATEDSLRVRLLFTYTKTGRAAYFPHHTVWNILASAFERSGVQLEYSQGFNPAPRLEISEPLSLGIDSLDEYGTVLLRGKSRRGLSITSLVEIARFLPSGLVLGGAGFIEGYEGKHIPSLSKLHWGSLYRIDFSESNLSSSSLAVSLRALLDGEPKLSGGSVVEGADTSINLLLPLGGKRDLGLQALFLAAAGMELRDSGVRVTRLEQYAVSSLNTPIRYFDYFKLRQLNN